MVQQSDAVVKALAARRTDRLDELARQIRDQGRRALAVRCDVTKDGDLEAAVMRARTELGRPRMMLAGVPGARRRLGSRDGRERGEEQEREGGEDSWPEAAHPLRVGRKLRLSELDDRNLDGWESPALRLAPAPGYRV